MERIVYRKTLDVHKNGIQFTLQGFETADNMARQIEISLMASGDTIDLPLEQIVAMMYVTTPNATEPSINECVIKDNKIIYDVLPIVEEGITEMQLKLIETRPNGAKSVLGTPRFAAEVTKGNIDDSGATQTTTFTALEDAIARANGVYESRLEKIEVDNDCTFRAIFADGTIYENDSLKEALYNGNALLSQSYARGDSGVRTGEETDNSMYYSNVSRSASAEATKSSEEAIELLEETKLHGIYTAFSIDFESGEVKYISPTYKFNVNKESGELEAIGKAYTPEETIELVVTEWLSKTSASLDERLEAEIQARETADYDIRQNCGDSHNDLICRIETLETKVIEDTEKQGCYYRVVNGEKEWFNPPMEEFVEYRTTERFLNKPVYTMTFGCLNVTDREYYIREYGGLFIGNSPALVINSNIMIFDHDENSVYPEDIAIFNNDGVPELDSSHVADIPDEHDLYATFKYIKNG